MSSLFLFSFVTIWCIYERYVVDRNVLSTQHQTFIYHLAGLKYRAIFHFQTLQIFGLLPELLSYLVPKSCEVYQMHLVQEECYREHSFFWKFIFEQWISLEHAFYNPDLSNRAVLCSYITMQSTWWGFRFSRQRNMKMTALCLVVS
jgi:hypothetical protein